MSAEAEADPQAGAEGAGAQRAVDERSQTEARQAGAAGAQRAVGERSQTAWRHRDHTRGNLSFSLLVLALPMVASSLAMAVFQLFDLAFISRLGEAPMAAVIIVNQSLRQVVFMLAMGASFGTQALVARAIGAGRVDQAEHIAGQAVLLGALFALGIGALGGFFPEWLFALPGPDPAFEPYGVPYLRLVFVLGFGVVFTMLFGGILGGAGDTTTPLLVTLVQTTVAIAGEWILIFGHLGAPALGVRGVALGVAAGQLTALGLGLGVLFRGRSRVHLRLRHLVPDPQQMRRIVAFSWPPALQLVGVLITTVAFLRLAREFGAHVQAAYAIGLRLGMIVPAFCFPLATAVATLVGQALGAGKPRRAWRAIFVGLLVHGCVMFSFAAVTFLYRTEIVSLFSDDPDVVRVGSEYLLYASGAFAMWAFYFVFMRALQGAGDVLVPMAISLGTALLISLPLAFTLARHTGLGETGIWIAFLVSSAVNTLATGAWLATGRWTRRAAQALPLPAAAEAPPEAG